MMSQIMTLLVNFGLLLLTSWVTTVGATENDPGGGAASGPNLSGGAAAAAASAAVGGQCRPDDTAATRLKFTTGLGAIEIDLFADAAPEVVAGLVAAAIGGDPEGGYYAGLTFDYTKPHTEIRTEERAPASADFDTRIDARALGLDEQGPRDAGAAMTIVQRELLVALHKNKRGDRLTPQLRGWLNQWYENYDAEFLVGVSRLEINEALGFSYADGLASKPVTRGSVALVPRGPQAATPRLSIALRDMPRRTGQWMVVGQVASGLEVVERISLAPLQQARSVKPITYTPHDPVAIESVVRSCPPHRAQ